jgi:hypothetical protein
VLGSTDDDDRNIGMGIVVEYENQGGEPQWIAPQKDDWQYAAFSRNHATLAPDETVNLKFEKIPGGQSLDDQQQVMAGHESAVHRAGGQTLSPSTGQQQRR